MLQRLGLDEEKGCSCPCISSQRLSEVSTENRCQLKRAHEGIKSLKQTKKLVSSYLGYSNYVNLLVSEKRMTNLLGPSLVDVTSQRLNAVDCLCLFVLMPSLY